MANCYFVIEKERPKLQKLRNLLELNFYCGKAADDSNESVKVNNLFKNKINFYFNLI